MGDDGPTSRRSAVPRLFLTRRWPDDVEAALRTRYAVTANAEDRPLEIADIRAAMLDHDVLCPTVSDRISSDILSAGGRVRLVADNGAGVDHIDLKAARSDVLSLHCPGGPETENLIDAGVLRALGADGIVINTARGSVIDEPALIAALNTHGIAGTGLDVFAGEPHVNPELLRLENVVLLPHLGSATQETRAAMGMRVLTNIDDFFAGRRPADLVQ